MTELTPNWDNGNRADHLASEDECKKAMMDSKHQIIEIPIISMTFVISHKLLIILRTTAMGSDTFQIEGGWVYNNPFSLMLDLNEIVSIPTAKQVK